MKINLLQKVIKSALHKSLIHSINREFNGGFLLLHSTQFPSVSCYGELLFGSMFLPNCKTYNCWVGTGGNRWTMCCSRHAPWQLLSPGHPFAPAEPEVEERMVFNQEIPLRNCTRVGDKGYKTHCLLKWLDFEATFAWKQCSPIKRQTAPTCFTHTAKSWERDPKATEKVRKRRDRQTEMARKRNKKGERQK